MQSSGATVSGLGVGPHTLTFSSVGGYTTPASQSVTVSANQTATASATYTSAPATGSLQVTLGPSDAVSAGALWSVDGGATQSSGAPVSGLSVGSHTVTFTSTVGYITPASQTVSVSANQTASASATYVAAAGSLRVTLSPAGAVTAGAQWSVDNGALQNSAATVSGLGVGSHTVVFSSVSGYTTPANQTVTVSANSTATATGAYGAAPTGSLQVMLMPSDAVSVNAQWEVDGGPLQNSGSIVSGLSVGSHTVVFNSVGGFLTPSSQSVTVASSKTTSATGTYTESQIPEITSPLAYTSFSTISFTYQATASHSPTKFYATGLPKGTALNATTGAITCKNVAVGTYPVTLSASNAVGTGSPSIMALTIVAGPPTVATSTVAGITSQTATLSGTANPKGGDTMAFFQYGPTTAYGSQTTPQDLGAGTATVTFHASLTGLAAATTYHYRAVALKDGGDLYGADKTFLTLARPVFATGPATPLLSASGAQLGFSVNPGGVSTSVYFLYSTDPGFATFSQTATQSIGNGKTAVNVMAFLSGLQPNMTYYYEMVSTSAAGTFTSSEQTFMTLGFDTALVANTGQSAPGTAFNFASLGNAAVDALDGAAFGAKTSSTNTASNAGIWANQNNSSLSLVAQTGSAAPGTGGAVFATLGDPVYNNNEDVAFEGTLKIATNLVTAATDTGVWATNDFTLGLVAREGSVAPGTGGATFASFGAVGMSDASGAILSGTLTASTALGVTTANNTGVWEGADAAGLTLLLRSGEQTDSGKTIASFKFLPVEICVNGQTRGFGPINGPIVVNTTYTDGNTGIVKTQLGASSPTAVATSSDLAAGTAGATFATFASPAINDNDNTAFAATLNVGVGDAVKANAGGIWADDSGGTRHLIARLGQIAPGTGTNATFLTFSDPVYNEEEAVAFRATLSVGTGLATTATASGLWLKGGGSLALVAHQGRQAPGCPTGVTFSAFTELALDDVNGGGVIFLATLGGTGVTTANNTAIFAVDNNGVLQLIVRTGEVINLGTTLAPINKTITALAFLPPETLVNGQARSFSPSTGDLVYNATFSDKSTAIYNVVFP